MNAFHFQEESVWGKTKKWNTEALSRIFGKDKVAKCETRMRSTNVQASNLDARRQIPEGEGIVKKFRWDSRWCFISENCFPVAPFKKIKNKLHLWLHLKVFPTTRETMVTAAFRVWPCAKGWSCDCGFIDHCPCSVVSPQLVEPRLGLTQCMCGGSSHLFI